MLDYRLYVMGLTSDRIDDFAEVKALNDEEAVRMAKTFVKHRRSELWYRSRLVEAFVPAIASARAPSCDRSHPMSVMA